MQPLPHEVRGKINDHKRAAASEAKRMAVSRKLMTISSCLVRCSKPHSLPGTLSAYALAFFLTFFAHSQLSQKHVPRLLTEMHTCHLSVQRSLRCREAYTANTYTQLVKETCEVRQYISKYYINVCILYMDVLHVIPIQTVTWFTRHVLCVLRILFIDK